MNIAIIGGGITGLTTALCLHKAGYSPTVFERAPSLEEIGAGIWLQPNAIQVLEWLGLKDRVISQGYILKKMEITYPNLKSVRKINRNVVSDQFGNQTIAIHRGTLQQILFEATSANLSVHLGYDYQNHQNYSDHVSISFGNKKVEASALLGADGIGSRVRQKMGLDSVLRKSGQICFRGIADLKLPEELHGEGKEMWGNKMRFGFSQIQKEKVYFFAVLSKDICDSEMTTSQLKDKFSDFDPLVSKIISSCRSLHVNELSDLKRLDRWSDDRVCLLGDAAHATTPNMGQGACQGIEDAYYISQLIRPDQLSSSLREFAKARRQKVDYVVNNSWSFGKMAHSPVGQTVLRGIMKLTPESVIQKQMRKLYTIKSLIPDRFIDAEATRSTDSTLVVQ